MVGSGAMPSAAAAEQVAASPARTRRRLDIGKLIMVPVAAVVLLADAWSLSGRGGLATAGRARPLSWLETVLVCAYYALVIVSYLRRGPALATHRSVTASLAAVLATLAGFSFPLLHGTPPGVPRQVAASTLLLIGMAWSLWSLWYLGRNLSVIAQARGLSDRGPYRFVRHPLYLGEITSALGIALVVGTPAAFAVWLTVCALQVYRARREEQILLQALPDYRDYRSRTAALVPGVF